MATMVRYNVWVLMEDVEDDKAHVRTVEAFQSVPGYVEHEWADSYEDEE